MGDTMSKIRDMEEAEAARRAKPVSPNLDVSNILYDHYFAACLSGILANPGFNAGSKETCINFADAMAQLAIQKRNSR